jgi:hypothetical protein
MSNAVSASSGLGTETPAIRSLRDASRQAAMSFAAASCSAAATSITFSFGVLVAAVGTGALTPDVCGAF